MKLLIITSNCAYNLNWHQLNPVKLLIEEGTGIPFYIDNDANVAALGEAWKGAGENGTDVVFVTLGTGVGGGIIANGNLLHGKVGAAGVAKLNNNFTSILK